VSTYLRIGDVVVWRGNFGTAPAMLARVTGLEVTPGPREKYGAPVAVVPWSVVRENRVVVTLDTSNWAYGEQIAPVPVGCPVCGSTRGVAVPGATCDHRRGTSC
jgi:hypothetical protein